MPRIRTRRIGKWVFVPEHCGQPEVIFDAVQVYVGALHEIGEKLVLPHSNEDLSMSENAELHIEHARCLLAEIAKNHGMTVDPLCLCDWLRDAAAHLLAAMALRHALKAACLHTGGCDCSTAKRKLRLEN